MNWSSTLLAGFLQLLILLYTTFDTQWDNYLLLLDTIFMASRLETQTKGWQSFPKPIGRLEPLSQRFTGYEKEREKTTTTGQDSHDECIYYPLVYGHEDKLKIVTNPTHTRLYSKSTPKHKSTPQSPLVKTSLAKKDCCKERATYGTGEDGDYAMLRSTVAQSSPPLKDHLASRLGRDCLHAPVSRSTLRALSNDFAQNKDRVMTFEPNSTTRTTAAASARRAPSYRRTNLSQNNNYVYELPGKAKNGNADGRFLIAPHFDDDFIEREDNEQLLDYCTCMCCVKGAFYHITKDSDNEGHVADEPCSCAGPLSQCLPRWACLGIFSLFLPCLCCYLPAKGCKNAIGNKTERGSTNSPLGVQSPK